MPQESSDALCGRQPVLEVMRGVLGIPWVQTAPVRALCLELTGLANHNLSRGVPVALQGESLVYVTLVP